MWADGQNYLSSNIDNSCSNMAISSFVFSKINLKQIRQNGFSLINPPPSLGITKHILLLIISE